MFKKFNKFWNRNNTYIAIIMVVCFFMWKSKETFFNTITIESIEEKLDEIVKIQKEYKEIRDEVNSKEDTIKKNKKDIKELNKKKTSQSCTIEWGGRRSCTTYTNTGVVNQINGKQGQNRQYNSRLDFLKPKRDKLRKDLDAIYDTQIKNINNLKSKTENKDEIDILNDLLKVYSQGKIKLMTGIMTDISSQQKKYVEEFQEKQKSHREAEAQKVKDNLRGTNNTSISYLNSAKLKLIQKRKQLNETSNKEIVNNKIKEIEDKIKNIQENIYKKHSQEPIDQLQDISFVNKLIAEEAGNVEEEEVEEVEEEEEEEEEDYTMLYIGGGVVFLIIMMMIMKRRRNQAYAY